MNSCSGRKIFLFVFEFYARPVRKSILIGTGNYDSIPLKKDLWNFPCTVLVRKLFFEKENLYFVFLETFLLVLKFLFFMVLNEN